MLVLVFSLTGRPKRLQRYENKYKLSPVLDFFSERFLKLSIIYKKRTHSAHAKWAPNILYTSIYDKNLSPSRGWHACLYKNTMLT